MTGDRLQGVRGRRLEDSQVRGKHEEKPQGRVEGAGIHGEEG